MLGLDQNAPYLLSAFGITLLVLAGYTAYLWSRLRAVTRRGGRLASVDEPDQSARNVSAAPPMATTAQPASSANGPSAP